MDLCQLVHEGMLRQADCMHADETWEFKLPPPCGPTWEGTYADDHVVCQRFSCKDVYSHKRLRDVEIVESSVASYLRNGARLSLDSDTSAILSRGARKCAAEGG